MKDVRVLFEIYLKPIKRDNDIDLVKFSQITKGLSPADIKMITEDAMKFAIINSRSSISMNDIEIAVNKFIRRDKVRNNKVGEDNG